MKRLLLIFLFIIFSAGALFLINNRTDSSMHGDYLSFYNNLDENNLSFSLYDLASAPFTKLVKNTLDGSYNDLVQFGKNSKYKVKVSQIKHEEAMAQLKSFYVFLKKINLCDKGLDESQLAVCKQKNNKIKSEKIISYVKNQIYNNAKIPYNNSEEYFYLNYKTIIDNKNED